MTKDRVIVIGAGAGGLAAAMDLSHSGAEVTVLERASDVGGKMRHVDVAGQHVDGGPTVFTMRWIFEDLFARSGTSLAAHLNLHRADVLARHAWTTGGQLDLYADINRSADAIADFAGTGDAAGYRAFCARGADIYSTLVQPFIASEKPTSPVDLAWRVGFTKLDALWRAGPMSTMWSAICENFQDPRLRQLFGRYATYVGSSPWLTPATLMLVAHVEQDGVWLVEGGMKQVAKAMQHVSEHNGARFRFSAHVAAITSKNDRVTGVILESGEQLEADAVIFNGDSAALALGLLGEPAKKQLSLPTRQARSLSALTWCMSASASGFPLLHHNVFFAPDYETEFKAIFDDRRIPQAPTVYICAQDRNADDGTTQQDPERLLVLINAPADGDRTKMSGAEIAAHQRHTFDVLRRCGLSLDPSRGGEVATTPTGFDQLFPASGGSLYGRASHGSQATFQRPGTTAGLSGLYLAGGSVHPGPGVPMATMSGRLAAARVLADIAARRCGGRRRGPVQLPVSANPK